MSSVWNESAVLFRIQILSIISRFCFLIMRRTKVRGFRAYASTAFGRWKVKYRPRKCVDRILNSAPTSFVLENEWSECYMGDEKMVQKTIGEVSCFLWPSVWSELWEKMHFETLNCPFSTLRLWGLLCHCSEMNWNFNRVWNYEILPEANYVAEM